MKLIIITGLPGSGKTTLRKQKFSQYPHVDIADIYVGRTVSPRQAFHEAMVNVMNAFDECDTVVLEAVISPNSFREASLIGYCEAFGIQTEWIWLWTPLAVCRERIQQIISSLTNPTDEEMAYQNARLSILDALEIEGSWA